MPLRRLIVLPLAFVLVLCVVGTAATAQPIALGTPGALLQQTTVRMLSALQQRRTRIQQVPPYLYTLVEDILVPHVDLTMASRWALGRHWREASPAQRVRFQHAFHILLVRLYATALAEYLDGHVLPHNVITFLPPRTPVTGDEAVVRTLVRPGNMRPVAVDYLLRHTVQGWQVCDVRVEGVSIIGVYRAVFNDEIHHHGVEGLITTLVHYNQRLSLER